uniref:Uncharacterized protein n=1 Tax=Vespula pensylvanica TaxID=30213 RepID=A0A834PBZ6_VESPE|nr:hypothetical protein H0235_002950 [Vespula pensylvanica]
MGSERDINLRSECEQAITRWSRSFSLWLELAGKIDSIHRHRYTFEVHYVAMIPLSALTRTHLDVKEKWKRYKARNDGVKKLLISDYARICWLLSKKLYRVLPLNLRFSISTRFFWLFTLISWTVSLGISNLNNGALVRSSNMSRLFWN